MTTTERPDKRLAGSGELTRLAGEVVVVPPVVIPPAAPESEEPERDPDVLGALGAWLCVLISAVIIATALLRWAWLVLLG